VYGARFNHIKIINVNSRLRVYCKTTGSAGRIGTTSIFFCRTATKSRKSPSSPRHVGRLLRSRLPKPVSAAHQSRFLCLTNWNRREAGWQNERVAQSIHHPIETRQASFSALLFFENLRGPEVEDADRVALEVLPVIAMAQAGR
jgi:hypothetical protein